MRYRDAAFIQRSASDRLTGTGRPGMRELRVAEQRYQAVLAVISEFLCCRAPSLPKLLGSRRMPAVDGNMTCRTVGTDLSTGYGLEI